MAVTPAGAMRATLGLDFEQFRTGTSQARRLAKDMSGDMSRSMGSAGGSARLASAEVKGFSASVQGAQSVALAAARGLAGLATGYMSIQAAAAAITMARSFNAALAETSTLIEGTPEQLNAITASARSMSRMFGGDATTQVKAFYQAISAGAGSVEEAAALIDTANRLAVGGLSDVTTATGILSGVLNTYGKDVITATEVSDSLFVGVKAGVTTVSELSSSLGKVLPAAKALGISFDETVAATAALTKNSMTTSEAVTGLSAVMNGVLQPTGEALKMAQDLSLEFSAAALQTKGLTAFLDDMVRATGGNAEKMAALFGSAEALKVALLFAGEAGGQYADILDQMTAKSGMTDEAFQKISKSLDQRWIVAVARARDVALVLGNALLAVVVPAVELLSGAFVLIANHGDIVAAGLVGVATALMASVVPAAWAAVAGFGADILALTALEWQLLAAAAASRIFGAALLLSNPIGWAVGLGIATAGIYAWATSSGQAASAAGIQAQAAETLKAALDGVNLVSAEGKTKANELAEATINAARADVLAARIKMANSQALLQMNGGFAFAAGAQKAREEMERAQAVLTSLIAEADRLGLVISKTPIELANAGGKAVDLARLFAIAKGEGIGIATAVGSINMDAATSGAISLAGQLGVALDVATKLNATLNANAGISTAKSTPRSGPALGFGGAGSALPAGVGSAGISFNSDPITRIRNQQLSALQNWTPPKASGGGGGGGASAIDKQTKSIKEEIKALEQAANPMLKYNEGIAHLNALKKAGLSDKGYAEGIRKLKKEMESATPTASALTSALTDGIGQGVDYMLSGFKGGLKGMLDIFKSTIMQMISFALKNKIMVSLGIGGAGGIGSAAAAGTAATAQGGILGGASGLLGGISSFAGSVLSGGMGLITSLTGAGGGLATAGTYLSSVLGGATTSLAGFGAAIGAIALPIAGIAAVFSFFKKKTTELDSGLRVTVDNMGALVESFSTTKTTRFWGLSKKIRTNFEEAAASVADPLRSIVGQIQTGVLSAADALGIGASAFEGFSHQMQISTKGMSEADAQKAITDALQGLGDAFAGMIPDLKRFAETGEGASATLQRLSSHLTAANQIMDTLGHSLFNISLAGAGAASDLVKLFGGLDAFNSATTDYFQGFYSEQERFDVALRQITTRFADLNVAMPASRAQFRAIVEAIDISTQKGRELYAALVSMSGALDKVLPAVASFTAEIQGLVGSITSEIDGLIGSTSDAVRANEQAATLWYRTATTLRDFIADLRGVAGALISGAQAKAFNEARFQSLLASSLAGDSTAAGDLPNAAKALLDSTKLTAKTAIEQARAEARVLSSLGLVSGVADIEGARHDVIAGLLGEQVSLLQSVRDAINSGDPLSPADISGLNGQLGALEAAIKAAEMINYGFLKERLQVTVDLLATASIPAELRTLLANAQNGVSGTIDFITRSDLTPDLKWLALTSASEHIKTIDLALGKTLDPATAFIAVTTASSLTKVVNLVAGAALPADVMRLALAGNSELSRTVNAVLASNIDEQAKKLALGNVGAYAVAVGASLLPSVGNDVRKIVFGDIGSYTAMIDAAISDTMSAEARRILLAQQGQFVANITGVLVANMSDPIRTLLLQANTTGARAVTLSVAFAQALTPEQRAALEASGSSILRTVSAAVNMAGISPLGLNYLTELGKGQGVIARGVQGGITLSGLAGSGNPLAYLMQLTAGPGVVARAIQGGVLLPGLAGSGSPSAYLMQLAAGSGVVARAIQGGVLLPGLAGSGNPAAYLQQLALGTGTINRIISGSVDLSGLNAQQQGLLLAINGASSGKLTLGGSFLFDPTASFKTWFGSTISTGFSAPISSLQGALQKLAETMDRQARIAELDGYAQNLVAAGNGQFIVSDQSVQKMASILGLNQNQSIASLKSQISAYSSGDAINSLSSYTPQMRDYLIAQTADPRIKVDPSAYLSARPDVARHAYYSLHPQEHWETYGRKDMQKDSTWFNPRLFDWISLGLQIPAFASGGMHSGGLRLVGENGPELEATGPSRIYNARQTAQMMGGDNAEMVQIMLALREEMRGLREEQRQIGMQIAADGRSAAKTLRKFDIDGLPPERV